MSRDRVLATDPFARRICRAQVAARFEILATNLPEIARSLQLHRVVANSVPSVLSVSHPNTKYVNNQIKKSAPSLHATKSTKLLRDFYDFSQRH